MPTITDLRAPVARPLDGLIAPLCRDARDVSLARTAFFLLPTGLLLIALNFAIFSWWSVALYWAFYLYFMGPCTLMMHNLAHRRLLRERRWDTMLLAGVGAMFGHSPGTYPGHHLSMHHREDNGPEDASSTLPYQRDSIVDFGRYVGRFMTIGLVDLGRYLWRKGRKDPLRDVFVGEIGWYAMCGVLAYVHLGAALACFIIPTLTTRFLLMSGNWAQHAFIDPEQWDNSFRSVTTFINSGYNARCFNDGYHLNHHLRASAHWTELPERFEEIRDDVVREQAVVFERIDYFVIWLLLMLRRHRTLARFMVEFGEETSIDDRVALLRSRLKPIRV